MGTRPLRKWASLPFIPAGGVDTGGCPASPVCARERLVVLGEMKQSAGDPQRQTRGMIFVDTC